MKQCVLRALVISQWFVAANAGLLFAQANAPAEAVICRTNTSLLQRGGELTPLTNAMTMPGGIEVFTNGTFRVKEGKARLLKEGQVLRAEGYLVNLDGTGLERVTLNDTFDGFPMFNRDGSKLVFASNRHGSAPGETNIFIADWKPK